MKKHHHYRAILLSVCTFFFITNQKLVAQQDSTPAKKITRLHYYNSNNSLQYIILESMLKKGKVLSPRQHLHYALYLDSSTAPLLLANMETNESGVAKAFIPPAFKTAWDASPQHTFIIKEGDEEIITDFTITKSKIALDTVTKDGIKNIIVSVMKLEKEHWVPAKDVEMKIGVQRLASVLPANDAATYTTDSTGTVTVELKKINLPGNEKGNIVLLAKTEDNDVFGNLEIQKTVHWGVATVPNIGFFDQRTLWSTRFRTPYWLLIMAWSIVIGVWGTIIYLVVQLIKIKKLSTM